MATAPAPAPAPAAPQEFHTFGLPPGSVRGILSVLICSYFWILFLFPAESTIRAPLGHFFLLTLVFLAFASNPFQDKQHFLPWLMKILFVGGSVVAVAFAIYSNPHAAAVRLSPDPKDVEQWPALLGCLAGGFAVALFLRFVLGRHSPMFITLRAWVGVLAILLLLGETVFQYMIVPNIDPVSQNALKVWEGTLIASVAAYFGARA
jgi:hypothetical protein